MDLLCARAVDESSEKKSIDVVSRDCKVITDTYMAERVECKGVYIQRIICLTIEFSGYYNRVYQRMLVIFSRLRSREKIKERKIDEPFFALTYINFCFYYITLCICNLLLVFFVNFL